MDRDELNRHPSARGKWPKLELVPEDESVHFYNCEACGQAVDKRKLGDVIHHEEAGHEPIPEDTEASGT